MAQDILARWTNGLADRETSTSQGQMHLLGAKDKLGHRVIYSYGEHFPLAIRGKITRLPKVAGRKPIPATFGTVTHLVNGDHWSGGWNSTTGSDQQDVIRWCEAKGRSCAQIPFSALAAAGVLRRRGRWPDSDYERDLAERLDELVVVENVEDKWWWECGTCGREAAYLHNTEGGKSVGYLHVDDDSPVCKPLSSKHSPHNVTQQHQLGGCLFKWRAPKGARGTWKRGDMDRSEKVRWSSREGRLTWREALKGERVREWRWFVSSLDDNPWDIRSGYFLAELPKGCEPETLKAGLECLKPLEVAVAEGAGVEVRRQGDVFFVEQPGFKLRRGEAKKRISKQVDLGKIEGMDRGSDTSSHKVSEAVMQEEVEWKYRMCRGEEVSEGDWAESMALARGGRIEKLARVAGEIEEWEEALEFGTGKKRGYTEFSARERLEELRKHRDDIEHDLSLSNQELVDKYLSRGDTNPKLVHGAYQKVAFSREIGNPESQIPLVVRGVVKHTGGDHSMLRLYDDPGERNKRWWKPIKNRALGGWGAVGGGGRVD